MLFLNTDGKLSVWNFCVCMFLLH